MATSELCAQQSEDTLQAYKIPEVVVSERYRTQEVRAASPTQTLNKEQLKSLNALQLSDAVKHFAGVTVKDYGGIGGLKTVSLRSLGSAHTGITYDGISVGNMQSGQTDIGRFSLDNVDRLVLNNGQSDNIFQPARSFASAGVLNIQTLTPSFSEGKNTNISTSLKAGSWELINPSLLVEQKVNNKWALSLNGEWMSSNGRYPYTMYYADKNDSTSGEKRINSSVKKLRTEVGLFGNLSDTEQWRVKAYYYQASRGIPGATIMYYNFSTEHLWDKETFIQSFYKKEFSPKWVFQTAAKWNWSYQRYSNPDYNNESGTQENKYYQQEYYLSGSLLYRAFNNLSFSLSTDGSINTLNASQEGFAYPKRYSWLTAIAGKYVNEQITASASLLATVVNEEVKTGEAARNRRKLSPYTGISIKPFEEEELRVRFFYKHIFRLPSFNDLYYLQVGNKKLNPENTSQFNLGVTYSKEINDFIPFISATIDAYYNKVTDKIVAIPNKSTAIWTIVNVGEVDIKGIDATASVSLELYKDIQLNLSGNYTYQRVLDVTASDSKTYKHQLAYTPRVFGSGHASLATPWATLSYSLLHSGKRYVMGENKPANRIASYSEHSLSLSKDWMIKKVKTSLQVEVLNFLDETYNIVRYYPMPGRSVRATLKVVY
nr:TonB-dependent receptor plug domain-containing protein [Bacteroides sp. 224]